MPTRAQLEKLADEAAASAAEHGRLRAVMLEQERQLRAMAAQALPSTSAERSMLGSKMELQNAGAKSTRVKISAARTEQDTDAKKALLDANLTPQDVADTLKVGRSTVNAWCNGTRSIPRRYRDKLADKHGIPASVWKSQAE